MRHLIFFLALFALCASASSITAKEPPNVIWVSMDGVSRNTFYAMLQKKRLPTMQRLLRSGNYRNLDILTPDPQMGYPHFLTGMNSSVTLDNSNNSLRKTTTVFEKVKTRHKRATVHAIVSNTNTTYSPHILLNKTYLDAAGISLHVSSSDSHAFTLAKQAMTQTTPVFVFIQQSEAADSVLRYREGTERYSDILIDFDRRLGDLIRHYQTAQPNTPLYVIISSSYGFQKHARTPSAESWILSNIVISRKAFSGDIAPSILALYDIPAERPPYIGSRLF